MNPKLSEKEQILQALRNESNIHDIILIIH